MRFFGQITLLLLLPLASGCAVAHAMAPNARIDWVKECTARCKDPTAITVYKPDNTAAVHYMALVSISPPVGCLCPDPPPPAPGK